jgi:hypothetical protein
MSWVGVHIVHSNIRFIYNYRSHLVVHQDVAIIIEYNHYRNDYIFCTKSKKKKKIM